MTGSNGSKVRVPNEAFDFDDDQIYEFEGRPFTSIAVADELDGGRSQVAYDSATPSASLSRSERRCRSHRGCRRRNGRSPGRG
jgi:hypothetical protein